VRRETKVPIHFGVGIVFQPAPDLTPSRILAFQSVLAKPEYGISFQQVNAQEGAALQLVRQTPPFTVSVAKIGGQGAAIAQLTVISAPPPRRLEDFAEEAESVLEAYRAVWTERTQVIRRDCVLRYLYDVDTDHAFRYLWEQRLNQADDSIQRLGRPVLGGGLRFFLPPREQVEDDTTVDVRIESFFQDPKKLFVETQMLWTTPIAAGADVQPSALLSEAAAYTDGPITDFILSE
jgi:hypothetical protein